MADAKPCKDDIQAIFKKLRAISTNKVCFDCDAKNPTWATVTYGVFICIDCSAVHRSLGVHLTFVRSTQLDTNWTWIQLRQMQLGGNANASVFFRQHNCVTTDAQQKYTSRAAQLYKDKLSQLAQNAMAVHGTELYLDAPHEKPEETKKELDFFAEHSFPSFSTEEATPAPAQVVMTPSPAAASLSGKGPSVDPYAPVDVSERKSIIGGRKPAARKGGLGAKKTGLGAQRVVTNFDDIEREAEMMDQRKEKQVETQKPVVSAEEEQDQIVSMRLAYQDLSVEVKKQEEKLKRSDPKKAQQMERLGMGYANKSGFSHSAMSDMQTIDQESPVKTSRGKSSFDEPVDDFFDDYSFPTSLDDIRSMNRTKLADLSSYSSSSTTSDDRYMTSSSSSHKLSGFGDLGSSSERSTKNEKPASIPSSKSWYGEDSRAKRDAPAPSSSSSSGDGAQKKFGNAKAISSDQFFRDGNAESSEAKANLSRFEGSSSICSDDYFQREKRTGFRNNGNMNITGQIPISLNQYHIDEMQASVAKGMSKIAEKVSTVLRDFASTGPLVPEISSCGKEFEVPNDLGELLKLPRTHSRTRHGRLRQIPIEAMEKETPKAIELAEMATPEESLQERVRRESLEQVRRECDAKIERERRLSDISLENRLRRPSLIYMTKRRVSVQLPSPEETDADTWTNRARGIVRRYLGRSDK